MMLASASKCTSFFDQCREYENEEEYFALRTFGISVTGPGKFEAGLKAAQLIGSQLMRYWISGDDETTSAAQAFSEQLIVANELDINRVCQRIQSSIEAATQKELSMLLKHVKENLKHTTGMNANELAKMFDSTYLTPTVRQSDEAREPKACLVAEKEVKRWAPEVGEQVVVAIQKVMDGKSMNLALAYETSKQITEQFRDNTKHCLLYTSDAADE